MESVNKTLYIPLYGKAYVSKQGILLKDAKAEEIWAKVGFPLKGKSRSKYLAYYMAMRAAVFDAWADHQMKACPRATVLHLGCGLDGRILRTAGDNMWYDVDFPSVIAERRKYFREDGRYTMVAGDVTQEEWLSAIPQGEAIVLMEGISMYLVPEALYALFARLDAHFTSIRLLMDCYTTFAAKASKHRNPVGEVGVTAVYGLDDPALPTQGTGITYAAEHEMTPKGYMDELTGLEKQVFQKLYAGKMAQKLYRLYEYKKG